MKCYGRPRAYKKGELGKLWRAGTTIKRGLVRKMGKFRGNRGEGILGKLPSEQRPKGGSSLSFATSSAGQPVRVIPKSTWQRKRAGRKMDIRCLRNTRRMPG